MLTCTAIHATCSVHTETAFTICFNNHRKYVNAPREYPLLNITTVKDIQPRVKFTLTEKLNEQNKNIKKIFLKLEKLLDYKNRLNMELNNLS